MSTLRSTLQLPDKPHTSPDRIAGAPLPGGMLKHFLLLNLACGLGSTTIGLHITETLQHHIQHVQRNLPDVPLEGWQVAMQTQVLVYNLHINPDTETDLLTHDQRHHLERLHHLILPKDTQMLEDEPCGEATLHITKSGFQVSFKDHNDECIYQSPRLFPFPLDDTPKSLQVLLHLHTRDGEERWAQMPLPQDLQDHIQSLKISVASMNERHRRVDFKAAMEVLLHESAMGKALLPEGVQDQLGHVSGWVFHEKADLLPIGFLHPAKLMVQKDGLHLQFQVRQDIWETKRPFDLTEVQPFSLDLQGLQIPDVPQGAEAPGATKSFEVHVSTLQRLDATLTVEADNPEMAASRAAQQTDIEWTVDHKYAGKLTINTVQEVKPALFSRPPGPGHQTPLV